jgi:hypothetical protein
VPDKRGPLTTRRANKVLTAIREPPSTFVNENRGSYRNQVQRLLNRSTLLDSWLCVDAVHSRQNSCLYVFRYLHSVVRRGYQEIGHHPPDVYFFEQFDDRQPNVNPLV